MTEQLQVKVSWKLGNIELQYEGNEGFLKTELPRLFQELLEIYKAGSKDGELNGQVEHVKPLASLDNPTLTTSSRQKLELGLNAIATKLDVKGPIELCLAACAYLALVQHKVTFSRAQIRETMETANLYKETYNKSLSQYINSLMKKGFLQERSTDVYECDEGQLNQLQDVLAGKKQPGSEQANGKGGKIGRSKSSSRGRSILSIVKELNLNPEGKQSFKDFVSEKQPNTNGKKCTVAVYYLHHILGIENITVNHVYTCYKNAGGWKVPDIANVLYLTASGKGWLDTGDMNSIKITHSGDNLVEFDLAKKGT